ncbi:MAG TPA: thioesterase family protein [Polyangiaceae bacterium]
MTERKIETRDRYKWHVPITSRWMDNDVYGHVNNVVYYSWFDTAANVYLIEKGGLDIAKAEIIGVVAESKCMYLTPISYPSMIEAGLRVDKLGNSSVTYGIGIFSGEPENAAAHGHFVHVFVDRKTMKPVPIPTRIRDALAALQT